MLPIYYTSDEANAPVLNNSNGSFVALLDAVLVNGFNLKSVTSIVVAAGLATVTCSGHQFSTGRRVQIAGATPSGLNGNQLITVVDANTFTYPTTVSAGTATGTITAKRPSLGWTKLYSGTNKAVYQRTDAQATSMLLRVDDTGSGVATTTYARGLMVESATDVDTYSAPAPTVAQLSGGVYLPKGTSSTTAKTWYVVGDGRTVYLMTDDSNYSFASYGTLRSAMFGDIQSFRSGGDAYGCGISACTSTSSENVLFYNPSPTSGSSLWLSRATNHIGSAISAAVNGFGGYAQQYGGSGPTYPSPVDGGITLNRANLVRENTAASNYPIRGILRGVVQPFGNVGTVLHGSVISGVDGSTDSYLCVAVGNQSTSGCVFFNITSEWA